MQNILSLKKSFFFFPCKNLMFGNKLVVCNVDEEEGFLKVLKNKLRSHGVDDLQVRQYSNIPF